MRVVDQARLSIWIWREVDPFVVAAALVAIASDALKSAVILELAHLRSTHATSDGFEPSDRELQCLLHAFLGSPTGSRANAARHTHTP